MKPITRSELFMATAAGEYSGELPEPVTRSEFYWQKIAQRIDEGSSVSPESIDAAIEDYLNSHDADIVTEAELTDALESKADSADIPDVSGFIGADVNNLTNYYDKDTIDAALNEKQNMLTAGDNISIETVNGELIISAADTTYSDATQQTRGLMSAADKTKLDGITAAKMQAWDVAEQNVNADWTAESGDAQILHKPDLSVYALAANVTKSALGIDNVDNTSDADKPISTAVEAALSGKAAASHTHTKSQITDLANATTSAAGLMSAADKTKIDGLGTAATANKGAVNGVASLDGNGKVPLSQLPSRRTVLNSNSVNLITSTNRELDLGDDVANYEAIEIRYLQYSNGSTNYYTTLRAANSGGSYGVIPAIRYIHNTATGVLNICICQLSLNVTKLKLVDDGGMPSGNTFYVSTVIGYR